MCLLSKGLVTSYLLTSLQVPRGCHVSSILDLFLSPDLAWPLHVEWGRLGGKGGKQGVLPHRTVGPSDSGHPHRPSLGQSRPEEDQRTRQGDRFFLLSLAILARFSGAHGEARGIVLRREVAVSAEIHSHPAGK